VPAVLTPAGGLLAGDHNDPVVGRVPAEVRRQVVGAPDAVVNHHAAADAPAGIAPLFHRVRHE
jgi:hypothetical protein